MVNDTVRVTFKCVSRQKFFKKDREQNFMAKRIGSFKMNLERGGFDLRSSGVGRRVG
jgi:hypothetical protein